MKLFILPFLLLPFLGFSQNEDSNNRYMDLGLTPEEEPYFIAPDRPGLGESSQIVRKGYVQIETGGNYEWTSRGDGDLDLYLKSILFNSTVVRIGLFDAFEIRLATNVQQDKFEVEGSMPGVSYSNNTNIGFTPFSIGFKARVTNGKGWIPSTALLGNLGIGRAASSEFQTSYLSPSILMPMEWDLSDKLLMTINGGVFWDGETAVPSYFGSFGFDYMLFDKVGIFLETYANQDEQNDFQPGFNGGVIWRVLDNLQLDISSGMGLNDNMYDGFINGGLSFRLGK